MQHSVAAEYNTTTYCVDIRYIGYFDCVFFAGGKVSVSNLSPVLSECSHHSSSIAC